MSKFSKADGVPVTLDDTIGNLGRDLLTQPHFNSESIRLKARLIKDLSEKGCVRFTANVTNYGIWRVGEAMLYSVPPNRRGALRSIIVHGDERIDPGKAYSRWIRI
jgi:hypothetical protein